MKTFIMSTIALISVLNMGVFLPNSVSAQQPLNAGYAADLSQTNATNTTLSPITSIGGGTAAAAIDGTTAFVGEGRTISVLNISNPANPTKIGSIELPGLIHNLELVNSQLYAAIASYGLVIIDISTPTSPTKLGAYASYGNAYDLAVDGNTLYLANGPKTESQQTDIKVPGLEAIDISNPQQPVLLSQKDINAYDIDIAGTKLYATGNANPLMSYDISDPKNITLIDEFVNTRNISYGVRAIGNRIYVTENQSGLHIIDTSAPDQHYWAADNSFARDIDVDGNRAYVVTTTGKLIVLDVTDLTNIQTIGTYRSGGNSWDVQVANGHAYLLDGNGGLKILDVSHTGTPTLLGTYNVITPNSITINGNNAYVSSAANHFSVFGLSAPQSPSHIATVDTVTPAITSAITGSLALVVNNSPTNPDTYLSENGSFQIFDISSTPPTLKSTIAISSPLSVAVEGNYALVGTYNGIEIYDIHEPTLPQKIATKTNFTDVTALQIVGSILYVGSGTQGFQIVDIRDMQNWVSHDGFPWVYTQALQVNGSTAYIQFDSEILIADISNIDSIQSIGIIYSPMEPLVINRFRSVGTTIYVALGDGIAGRGGLAIVDASNPATPIVKATSNLDSSATDVAVQGDYVYAATPQGGLQVLHISTSASIPTTGGSFQAPDGGPLFTFADGTFASTVTLNYSSCAASAVPSAGALAYGGVCYDILATTADGKAAAPQKPYTVRISDVDQTGEYAPALYWWDGGWQREASSSYDAASKTLTATPSHFSTWGVLSGPAAATEHTIYIPIAVR